MEGSEKMGLLLRRGKTGSRGQKNLKKKSSLKRKREIKVEDRCAEVDIPIGQGERKR